MHRRRFLQTTLRGFAGIAGLNALPLRTRRWPAHGGKPVSPEDTAFWQQVRNQFPLTRKRIYLNTGGLGPSPYPVIDTVRRKTDTLERISESGHTHALWQEVKSSCARLLGCSPEELAFTRNTTEGINIVCHGLPLEAGDEVITSTHEHVGNTLAWLLRQKKDGIRIRTFEPSMLSAQENIQRIEKLITPRTRVLSLMHVSTATGHVLPLRTIGELAKQHKLWFFVDGAQAAGMLPVDLAEIGCHAWATSGHKWMLGPKGTGLLYVRKDMLDTISAQWIGAYSNSGTFDIRTGEFHLHPSAQRYEYGTVNTALVAGLGAAARFLLDIGPENIWQHNLALANKLRAGLRGLGCEDLSAQYPEGSSAMVTFRVPGMARAEVQNLLASKHKLRTRGVYEGGLDGVRISLHLFNSFEEIDRIIEAVAAIKKHRK